jgi:prevent-host-death family protein
MPHIGIRELQRRTSRVVARVEAGEALVVTRHNRPVVFIAGIEAVKHEIRLASVDADRRRRLRYEFERFIWSGELPPIRVSIAEACGDRPVREFPYED